MPLLAFLEPGHLWALVLVPLLIGSYIALLVIRGRRNSVQGDISLQRYLPRERAWVRHGAVALATLSLISLIVAWARPKAEVLVPRERATVIMSIDVSKSMIATDVSPDRITAVKQSASAFVDQLPRGFNVGLVKFAGTASLVVQPTSDRDTVKNAIENLQLAPSTAIGDGIYASLDALSLVPSDPLHPDDAPPAVVVLLSDGGTNMGRPSADAAKQAKQMNVPVNTIAYGTQGGYIVEQGQRQPVPVNKYELQQVANLSGGKMYTAESNSELKEVYKGLASSIGMEKQDKEVTSEMIWVALLSGVLASLGVISIAARWP